MTFRWLTAIAVGTAGGLAWWRLPLDSLFAAFQPATVALSIMAAAVLVRLNRGMPTLDWKTLEPAGRKRLTAKIVELQKDYLSLLAINAFIVGVLIALVVATLPTVEAWDERLRKVISGILCGGMVLVIARMGLVVWRDYDIVRLQKVLIDAAADKEQQDAAAEAARQLVEDMRSSAKPVAVAPIKSWEDRKR